MRLSELSPHQSATVVAVDELRPADPISRRLRDLGFVHGEAVKIVAQGPVRRDPLLIQIGYTRFALRRSEADRVRVEIGAAA